MKQSDGFTGGEVPAIGADSGLSLEVIPSPK